MKSNFEATKDEIRDYLASENFVAFHAQGRSYESVPIVRWDTASYPDYRLFLDCALKIGVRLIAFHHEQFDSEMLDEALDMLHDAELPPDEEANLEQRVQDMRVYEGFICSIELSFDYDGRMYLFLLNTDWYEELQEILDDLEESIPEDEAGDSSLGGYFSNN